MAGGSIGWVQKLSFGTGHVLNDLAASVWFSYLLVYLQYVLLVKKKKKKFIILRNNFRKSYGYFRMLPEMFRSQVVCQELFSWWAKWQTLFQPQS